MKLPGRDLVAERLADLGDPERRLLARVLKRRLEVEEDALGGLRARGRRSSRRPSPARSAVSNIRLNSRASVRSQSWWSPGSFDGAWPQRTSGCSAVPSRSLLEVVGAEAALAGPALDERVAEPGQVARRLPGARVLDDRRVEGDDVVALLDHRPPPGADHVVLQENAVVPVVVGVGDARRRSPTPGRSGRAACRARRSCPWSPGRSLGGAGYRARNSPLFTRLHVNAM